MRRAAATRTLAALLLSAATAASAMPTAVERGVVVQGGLQFQKTIVLNEAALCDGSVRLAKGSYDVHFESLGGNKVRASFFQGGVRKGEANGIIVVNSAPADLKSQTGPGGGPHAATPHAFGHVAFGPEYGFTRSAGKLDLVVGRQGSNQILIGLLLPAVLQQHGVIAPPQKR